MGRVSVRNYVIQKRITLLDFGIFWDFSGFVGFFGILNPKKSALSPLFLSKCNE